MTAPRHTSVGTFETVRNFYGKRHSVSPLVLISQNSLRHINFYGTRHSVSPLVLISQNSLRHINFYGKRHSVSPLVLISQNSLRHINFYGKRHSVSPLVLISQKSLRHINLPRRSDGNRSVSTTRPKSYFHHNSFYISHFASNRDKVNFI